MKNDRVHTFISTKNLEKLNEEPREGTIYIIADVKVNSIWDMKSIVLVRFDKHIYFTEHTTCNKDEASGLPIEPHFFNFLALEEIKKNADDNRFLISSTLFI